jgi:hypothetical protein
MALFNSSQNDLDVFFTVRAKEMLAKVVSEKLEMDDNGSRGDTKKKESEKEDATNRKRGAVSPPTDGKPPPKKRKQSKSPPPLPSPPKATETKPSAQKDTSSKSPPPPPAQVANKEASAETKLKAIIDEWESKQKHLEERMDSLRNEIVKTGQSMGSKIKELCSELKRMGRTSPINESSAGLLKMLRVENAAFRSNEKSQKAEIQKLKKLLAEAKGGGKK